MTGSRLEAVRYKQSFDKYIKDKGYPIKSLVAFSGTVQDDKLPDVSYTEEAMNAGLREKELPERFASVEYQVLLVAEKYQTGFDQPLLHTMYVDKRLAGIQAVQTRSGSSCGHPGRRRARSSSSAVRSRSIRATTIRRARSRACSATCATRPRRPGRRRRASRWILRARRRCRAGEAATEPGARW